MSEGKRDFDGMAASWDENPHRVRLARAVGDAIICEVRPDEHMDAMDFGAGTGLLTLALQPLVRSITAIDTSQGMLSVLDEKIGRMGMTNAKTQLLDLAEVKMPDQRFHLIVSNMTIHHVPDVEGMIRTFYAMLHPGGFLCIADLDEEGGDFHGDNTGVEHYGFDRKRMEKMLSDAGFANVRISTAHTITRDVEGGEMKDFTIFLAVGEKPHAS